MLIEVWESKHHQQEHIEQEHMARLRALKPDHIISTEIGGFEVK